MNTYSIYPKQFNNAAHKLQSDSCFVVMPFSEELNNTYMVIESVASSMNIKCTRADNVSTTSEPILSKICTQISQAYFIIVDITDLNPNVFYELGIAHVLREASKVLIIKEKETTCPSDIRHIHYYEYSRSDLKQLKQNIEKFFAENNILEDLQSVLSFLDLLPKDNSLAQKFVVDVSSCIGIDMDSLILILNNQATALLQPQIIRILSALTGALNRLNSSDEMYALYSELILFIISKTHDICDFSEYMEKMLSGHYCGLSAEWIAECSVAVLDNPVYFHRAMIWALEYLKGTSPAAFDVAKYKIELGLIKAKTHLVDDMLVKELTSENKTLAEHCAKLVKERKTHTAIPVLLELITSENNPYVVRSCIDALVGMATLETLLNVRAIMEGRSALVASNGFINKHLEDLKVRIEQLQNTSYC